MGLAAAARGNCSPRAVVAPPARALASSANFVHLEHLDLHGNEIGDEGAKALGQSPHLGRLTTLVLSANGLRVMVHYLECDAARRERR